MIDVITVGETMALCRTDSPEAPTQGTRCTIGFGGADSNVAIGLARLGHSVRWISSLGKDAFGDMIESGIAEQGVEPLVTRSASRQTGLMVKTPSKSESRLVYFYRSGSAASAMTSDLIGEPQLSGAKILHLTGITPMLSESTRELVLNSAKLAKRLGIRVSFDVNFRASLFDAEAATACYRDLMPNVDMVFGDRAELSLLVGSRYSDEELLSDVAKLGPTQVALKLGEGGAVALINGELFTQAAVPVEVADTVGAGDAFVAGYLSGLLDSASPEETMFRAAFCGAQACRDLGDWEGAATRQELAIARQELVS